MQEVKAVSSELRQACGERGGCLCAPALSWCGCRCGPDDSLSLCVSERAFLQQAGKGQMYPSRHLCCHYYYQDVRDSQTCNVTVAMMETAEGVMRHGGVSRWWWRTEQRGGPEAGRDWRGCLAFLPGGCGPSRRKLSQSRCGSSSEPLPFAGQQAPQRNNSHAWDHSRGPHALILSVLEGTCF